MVVAIFASCVGLLGWLLVALEVLTAALHVARPIGNENPLGVWVVFAVMNIAAVWLFIYRRKLIRRKMGEPKSYGFPIVETPTKK